MLEDELRARVRALNDDLRAGRASGRIQLTRGVVELGPDRMREAMEAVARFNDFSPANDPYGEHDFGAFQLAGRQLFWKIDYYDPSFESAALDPADEAVCVRVLTVMLAEEY